MSEYREVIKVIPVRYRIGMDFFWNPIYVTHYLEVYANKKPNYNKRNQW